MFSTQLRQSEGSGFKSRSGQIAYLRGVKYRLSTLGTGDVPRGIFVVSRLYSCVQQSSHKLQKCITNKMCGGYCLGLGNTHSMASTISTRIRNPLVQRQAITT